MARSSSSTDDHDDRDDQGSELDIMGIFHLFLRRWWVMAICLGLTCGLALLYIAKTRVAYQAETIVQVEESERKVINIQDVQNEDLKTAEQLKTIEQNLSNQVVLQGVVDALKLTPDQLGLKPADAGETYTPAQLVRALDKATNVKLRRGTRLISIAVENPSPEMAQTLSTEVVKQFVRAYLEQRVGISNDASDFLVDERDRLKARMADSQKAVQDYKDAHPGMPLDDSQLLTDNVMLALNTQLNDARTARFRLESDAAQVKVIGLDKPLELLRVTSVATSQMVISMQRDLAAAESDFAALTERYLPKHPKYIQAQKKVADLRNNYQKTIIEAAKGVSVSQQGARETEDKAQGLLREQEQKRLDFSKISLPYQALVKDMESDQELYNNIQRRIKETDVTKSLEQENIRVVQPASVPDKPSKPKKLMAVAAAVAAGLLLGAISIFAMNLVDDSFKTVDQVEQTLNLSVIGSIPKASKAALADKAEHTTKDPNGQMAEAFRSLRASLSLLENGKEMRTTLFTSAIPSEGKSWCSVNYAAALAQLGEKTLIIDGDLRLPTVHTLLLDSLPELGVSSVMTGKSTVKEAAKPTKIANLSILAAGTRLTQPGELIAKGAFKKLIKEALLDFDRVVIDSAPIHAVSDSLFLMKDVDSVCVVIKAASTSRRLVNRAVQKILAAKGPVSGIVLNQLPKSGMNYYYYYSAGSNGVYGAAK